MVTDRVRDPDTVVTTLTGPEPVATADIVEDSINLVYTYSAADLHGRVLAGKLKRWRRLGRRLRGPFRRTKRAPPAGGRFLAVALRGCARVLPINDFSVERGENSGFRDR